MNKTYLDTRPRVLARCGGNPEKTSFIGLVSLVSLVGLTGSSVAACGGNNAPAADSSLGAVDAAYAALVRDVAQCAKQVDDCLEAADDDPAALAACRAGFDTCKQGAGEQHTNLLADAVRDCTATHRACVRAAHGRGAGECELTLHSCLSNSHPGQPVDDDTDAGAAELDARAQRDDCLDELQTCVREGGPDRDCAQAARSCVTSSLPAADMLAPQTVDGDADEEPDTAADDESGDGAKSAGTKGMKAPVTPSRSSMEEGLGKGGAVAAAARSCVSAFSACVDSGGTPRSCAQELRSCKSKL